MPQNGRFHKDPGRNGVVLIGQPPLRKAQSIFWKIFGDGRIISGALGSHSSPGLSYCAQHDLKNNKLFIGVESFMTPSSHRPLLTFANINALSMIALYSIKMTKTSVETPYRYMTAYKGVLQKYSEVGPACTAYSIAQFTPLFHLHY